MARLRLITLLLIFVAPDSVRGETLLLLQGYLEDGNYWREAGVTRVLEKAGWRDAGHLHLGPRGITASRALQRNASRFYTVSLPTRAPLLAQQNHLEKYLAYIRSRNPDESLVLIGHSAGGVLGRLFMVQHPQTGVDALITISSPHLGTDAAEIGVMAGNSPLAWLAPMVGAQAFNESQGLYQDLVRERPGSLLFWLNRQEHPMARYISVVRTSDNTLGRGDLVVPAWSQDMNNVYALKGRARSIGVDGNHGLSQSDGDLVVRILRQLKST